MDKVLCKASETAKVVINKCLEKGYDIDIIKLEQLLTLIQGTKLARYNKLFFPQDIYFSQKPIINEVHKDLSLNKICFSKNNVNRPFSEKEESIIDEIVKRFGVYDSDTLNTCFVFNILDKINIEKDKAIPYDYLKLIFVDLGFNISPEDKVYEGKFTSKYADLVITTFPKTRLINPEMEDLSPKHDLGILADNIAKNGFVTNYCLNEDEVTQLKLIFHYKKNYVQ